MVGYFEHLLLVSHTHTHHYHYKGFSKNVAMEMVTKHSSGTNALAISCQHQETQEPSLSTK